MDIALGLAMMVLVKLGGALARFGVHLQSLDDPEGVRDEEVYAAIEALHLGFACVAFDDIGEAKECAQYCENRLELLRRWCPHRRGELGGVYQRIFDTKVLLGGALQSRPFLRSVSGNSIFGALDRLHIKMGLKVMLLTPSDLVNLREALRTTAGEHDGAR